MRTIHWWRMIYEPKSGMFSPAVTGHLYHGIRELNERLKNESLEWGEIFRKLEIIPCPKEIEHEIFPYKEIALGRPESYTKGGRPFYKLEYK